MDEPTAPRTQRTLLIAIVRWHLYIGNDRLHIVEMNKHIRFEEKSAADPALTLHLHGYDIEQRISTGTTATMTFIARATGRCSIETHGSEGGRASTLVYIEVQPR